MKPNQNPSWRLSHLALALIALPGGAALAQLAPVPQSASTTNAQPAASTPAATQATAQLPAIRRARVALLPGVQLTSRYETAVSPQNPTSSTTLSTLLDTTGGLINRLFLTRDARYMLVAGIRMELSTLQARMSLRTIPQTGASPLIALMLQQNNDAPQNFQLSLTSPGVWAGAAPATTLAQMTLSGPNTDPAPCVVRIERQTQVGAALPAGITSLETATGLPQITVSMLYQLQFNGGCGTMLRSLAADPATFSNLIMTQSGVLTAGLDLGSGLSPELPGSAGPAPVTPAQGSVDPESEDYVPGSTQTPTERMLLGERVSDIVLRLANTLLTVPSLDGAPLVRAQQAQDLKELALRIQFRVLPRP